jgi:hypothetical protein
MASTINAQAGNSTTITALIKASDGTANLTLQTGGANALSIDNLQLAVFNSNGAVKMPAGTLAQRPTPAIIGMVRYNTTINRLEGYGNNGWGAFT